VPASPAIHCPRRRPAVQSWTARRSIRSARRSAGTRCPGCGRLNVYDDIEQTAAIGGAAVGLWEGKFSDGDDQKIADFMAEHGIAASFCVPRVHSILGIPFDRPGTPTDPANARS
jgi:hypothetical protein